MPYRRLPNTDLSRIAALKRITDMGGVKYKDVQVISYRTIQEVSMTLSRFQKAQRQYQQCYDSFIKLNKTFKTETQNARMYISHFIQVMNLAIQRGELKKDIKTSYGLDPKSSAVPDLTSEQNILDWGDKVIRGEEARTMKGGLPIYNPTIAKVKVHYDIFADHLFNIRVLRENVARTLDEITKMIQETEVPLPVSTLTAEEAAQGFEMLFDGTNLDKWTGNKDGYKIQNNTIYVSAGYGSGGNLYTVKEYKDFVYRFEFCFVRPGVNNGVGIRTPMGVDAAYYGMCESQILDHDDPIYAGWLREYQVHGSVYGVIPAKRIVHKPLGEWSTEEIRVQGTHITVTVNGEVIVDGDIKEACQGHNVAPDGSDHNPYTVDGHNHPGMFNETGHIGFLGHGAGVKFRNVRVLDLSPAKTAKKGRK